MSAAIYLEKAKAYKPSRFADIKLQGYADDVPLAEIPALMISCREIAVEKAQSRLDELIKLNAPDIILEPSRAVLAKAQAGKSQTEACLRRSLNKRK